MRVRHLNCGTCCPWGGRTFDGTSQGLIHGHIVAHCLLIETSAGLVLVDTGFGTQDVAHPERRLAGFCRGLNRPDLRGGTNEQAEEDKKLARHARSLGRTCREKLPGRMNVPAHHK
jgi:hypothetical protein